MRSGWLIVLALACPAPMAQSRERFGAARICRAPGTAPGNAIAIPAGARFIDPARRAVQLDARRLYFTVYILTRQPADLAPGIPCVSVPARLWTWNAHDMRVPDPHKPYLPFGPRAPRHVVAFINSPFR